MRELVVGKIVSWDRRGFAFAQTADGRRFFCGLYEDPIATARLKNRIRPRNNAYMRASYTHLAITNRQWSRIQKLGRQARWKRLSRVERADIMRAIALKRWRG
jgi:hypothetical protein